MSPADLLTTQARALGADRTPDVTAEALVDALSVERFGWPAYGSPAYEAVVAFRRLRSDARLRLARRVLEGFGCDHG